MSDTNESNPESATIPTQDGDSGGLQMAEELGHEVARLTEDLADGVLDRLKDEVKLPDVRGEAGRLMGFIRNPRAAFLNLTIVVYVLAAVIGSLMTVLLSLHDWYMHVAMYVVLLSFLLLYTKAHTRGQMLSRAGAAMATIGLMSYFAWVLFDLVAPRLVVVDSDVVERAALPLLRLPAMMLCLSAILLCFHWVVFSRRRTVSDG